jgi:glycosyltransferase involved in cell wall biosynthesis
MRLLYLSLSYIPSRRASSVQVMRMCDALARQGHEVTLVAKRGHEASDRSDHAFYGVSETFDIKKLARPPRRGGGVVFASLVGAEIAKCRRHTDLAYCRDVIAASLAMTSGMPVAFEAHAVPSRGWERALYRRLARSPRLAGIVAISAALRDDLAAEGMAPRHGKLLVAHDAADPMPPRRDRRPTRPRATIGYVGNLYAGRGVELVIELARKLPEADFVFVGGTEQDLDRWRRSSPPNNVRFRGFVQPADVAGEYGRFDIVLLPYPRHGIRGASGGSDTSKWCSPMKMFESMGSGAAIVASDLPVLREVLLHERNALIARADDLHAWQAAVERLLASPELAERLAAQARADLSDHYTWDARASIVMKGLGLS